VVEKEQKCVGSVTGAQLPPGTTQATSFMEALQASVTGFPVTFHTPGADEDLLAAATESPAPIAALLLPAALYPALAPGAFEPILAPGPAPSPAPDKAPAPGPAPGAAASGPELDEESGGGKSPRGGGGDGGDEAGDAGVNSKQTNSRDGGTASMFQTSVLVKFP
jgi:hypothetical protein